MRHKNELKVLQTQSLCQVVLTRESEAVSTTGMPRACEGLL